MGTTQTSVLVLTVDRDAGNLRIFLKRGPNPDGGSDDLELFRLPLAHLSHLAPGDAVALVGSRVLAAMAHLGEHASGYAGYKAITDQARSVVESGLLAGVAGGDPEAMYELALDRMFESVHLRSLEYLDEAEMYLKRAAEHGHTRATEFLWRVWPREKDARRRQILDGS